MADRLEGLDDTNICIQCVYIYIYRTCDILIEKNDIYIYTHFISLYNRHIYLSCFLQFRDDAGIRHRVSIFVFVSVVTNSPSVLRLTPFRAVTSKCQNKQKGIRTAANL